MILQNLRKYITVNALLALFVLAFVGSAHALGLGKLKVLSALDEPLVAEIELTSAGPGDLESLEVGLGAVEDFNSAGVALEPYLRTLEFSVVRGGTSTVRIISDTPAREPFLHFLVRASWDGGNLLREYTALLDPPLYAAKQPTAVSSPGVAEQARRLADAAPPAAAPQTGTAGVPSADPGAAGVAAAGASVAAAFAGAQYGPTREGDTLWSIASRLDTGGRDVNVFQIMVALLKQNPAAFMDNNINRLKKGQILRLASLDDIVDKEEASRLYLAQMADWESFRVMAARAAGVMQVPSGEAAAPGDTPATGGEPAEGKTGAAPAVAADQAGTEGGDLLKIVRASLDKDAAGGTGAQALPGDDAAAEAEKEIGTLRSRVATLEESLVSAELQNEELRERVAMLEEQVLKAQRLVELESQELAQAQQQAARQQEENRLLAQQLAEQQLEAQRPVAQASETAEAPAAGPTAEQAATTQAEPQQAAAAAAPAKPEQKARIDPRKETAADGSALVPTAAPLDSDPWWKTLIDSVLGNINTVIAGVGGILLLLAGAVLLVRRRRSLAEFEESILSGSGLDGQMSTTDSVAHKNTDTSFLSDFGMAGMGSMHADEVDPLAEAEVYLAYGRDEQAEEVLREAAARDPERNELKLKLLEIYQQRDDLKSFETLAEELYPAAGQGDPVTWGKVVEMGSKMNPANPLFSQSPAEAMIATMESAPPMDSADLAPADDLDEVPETPSAEDEDDDQFLHPFPEPEASADADEEFEQLAAKMSMNDESGGETAAARVESAALDDADMLDFESVDEPELDFEIDGNGATGAEHDVAEEEKAAPPVSAAVDGTDTGVLEFELPEFDAIDFDTEVEDTAEPDTEEAAFADRPLLDDTLTEDIAEPTTDDGAPERKGGGVRETATRTFDVYTGGGLQGAAGDAETESDKWDEAATKLDLAQAYLNMGDKAGARSIIDEVLKEGSPAQRDQAAELQAQIG